MALTINQTIKCLSLNTWLVEKLVPFYHIIGRKLTCQNIQHPHTNRTVRIHLSQLAFMCGVGWRGKMRYIFIKRTTLCFNLSNRTHTNPETRTETVTPTNQDTNTHTWSRFRSRHGLQISVCLLRVPKGPCTGYYIVLGNSLLL